MGDEPTSIDKLTEAESLPEANDSSIAAITEAKIEEAKEAAAQEAAKPVKYNKDGSVAKQRGRKKGETSPPKNASTLGGPAQPLQTSLAAAATISGLLEHAQVALISDEFIYSDMERALNIGAWEKTLDHYGGMKIHPAAELAMNHFAIIASRSQKEKTKTKLAHAKVWLSSLTSKWKKKKEDKKPEKEKEDALSGDRANS